MRPEAQGPAPPAGLLEEYGQMGLALAEGSLAGGGLLRLQVRGDSMLPALHPGEIVLIESAGPEALRRGDLVVVRRGGQAVTHRVIGRQAGAWLLKGDNRWQADPPLEPRDLIGRVVAVEREGRARQLAGSRWRRGASRAARLSAGEAHLDRLFRGLLPGRAGAALGRFTSLPLRLARRVSRVWAASPNEHP